MKSNFESKWVGRGPVFYESWLDSFEWLSQEKGGSGPTRVRLRGAAMDLYG